MRNLKVSFFILFFLVSFVGCATTTKKLANLEEGIATTAEFQSVFGEPNSKKITADGTVWQYSFAQKEVEPEKRIQKILELNVAFENDVFKDYEITLLQVKKEDKDKFKPEKRQRGQNRGMERRKFPPKRRFNR